MFNILYENVEINKKSICYCGSKKLFLECCIRKSNKLYIVDGEARSKIFQTGKNRKKCCYGKTILNDECSDEIIAAHTISRGTSLARLSENPKTNNKYTKVCGFNTNSVEQLIKNNSKEVLNTNISIKDKASTFKGFCNRHDNALFEPVDNGFDIKNRTHYFLQHYRQLSYDMYHLEDEIESDRLYFEFMKSNYIEHKIDGNYLDALIFKEHLCHAYDKLQSRKNGLKLYKLSKDFFDANIKINSNNNYSINKIDFLYCTAIEFEGYSPFNMSVIDTPRSDFENSMELFEKLQQSVSISLLYGKNNQPVLVLSCFSFNNEMIKYIKSLIKQKNIIDLILKLSLKFNNCYYNIDFIKSLGKRKNTLIDFYTYDKKLLATNKYKERAKLYLTPFEDIKITDCYLKNIITNEEIK